MRDSDGSGLELKGSQIPVSHVFVFFFQAEDGIRDVAVTGVQTCALPISPRLRMSRTICDRRGTTRPFRTTCAVAAAAAPAFTRSSGFDPGGFTGSPARSLPDRKSVV